MKVLTFAASNSSNSINAMLAEYVAKLVPAAQVERLNINDYEMPLFSVDRERELGSPAQAQAFFNKIGSADGIVVSYAEHNGSYTAAYKNLFDWVSRIDTKVFQEKPMLLLATSPGPGGAKNVLASAVNSAPHFGAVVKASLSLPNFHENFDQQTNNIVHKKLRIKLERVAAALSC